MKSIHKHFSIKSIAWMLGISMIFSSLMGVFITYLAADEEFNEVLEDDLQQNADLLSAMLVATKATPKELRNFLKEHIRNDDEDTIWVTVYNLNEGWQVTNLDHARPLLERGSDFIEAEFQNHGWHGYQHDNNDLVVQMFRRDDLTNDIIGDIAEDITAPTLIGSALSLLILIWLVRLIARPLTALSRELDRRGGDDLSPLHCSTRTKEIRILTDKLNRLMFEVDKVLTRERQFANDVAHELRTPLTTIKLELSCHEPDTQAIKAETERVNRIVEQLLTLARLEQQHWKQRFDTIELHTRLQGILDKYRTRFATKGIDLHVEINHCTIKGDATLLQVLIENLLSNILRHSAACRVVHVTLAHQQLIVRDDGQDVPQHLLGKISSTPRRLDSKGKGLGLGLTICQRIATIHQATVHLEDALPGLRVRVTFSQLPITSG